MKGFRIAWTTVAWVAFIASFFAHNAQQTASMIGMACFALINALSEKVDEKL